MCVCRTEGETYTWFGRYLHWTIGRKKGKIEILFTGSSYDIAWGKVSGASEIKYTIVDPTSLRQRKNDKRILKLLDDEQQTDVLQNILTKNSRKATNFFLIFLKKVEEHKTFCMWQTKNEQIYWNKNLIFRTFLSF